MKFEGGMIVLVGKKCFNIKLAYLLCLLMLFLVVAPSSVSAVEEPVEPVAETTIAPVTADISEDSLADITVTVTWGSATKITGASAIANSTLTGNGFALASPTEGVNYTITDNGDGTATLILKKEIVDVLPGGSATLAMLPEGSEMVVTFVFNNGKELAFTYTVVSGVITGNWLDGISDENQPALIDNIYEIYTPEELSWVAYAAYSGNTFQQYTIKLMNDIDLSGKEWTPIGVSITSSFAGIFDGNNKEISGLVINTEYIYSGFIGYSTGDIKDLSLKNGSINTTSVDKSIYAGGIAGFSQGIITNCYSGLSIAVDVTGDSLSAYAGGIAGTAASISESINEGSISASVNETSSNAYAGGITAYSNNNLINNTNSGQVSATATSSSDAYAGGICGKFDFGAISGCHNIADISATNSTCSYLGGIVGKSSGTITNCDNIGSLYASTTYLYNETYCGGISGYSSSTVSKCFNKGDVKGYSTSSHVRSGGIIGYNYSFISDCYNEGIIEATSIAYESHAGGIAGSSYYGSSITQCYNLGNVSALENGRYSGGGAGGIVATMFDYGTNHCIVSRCFNTGTILGKSSNYYVSAGGITARANGTIKDCYNIGEVTACNTASSYSGEASAAGIGAGENTVYINCYNTSIITVDAVLGHKGDIAVEGTTNNVLENCYILYSEVATGPGTVLTKDQFISPANFVGFDFDNVWSVNSNMNNGFPYLTVLGANYTVISPTRGDIDKNNPADTTLTIIWGSATEVTEVLAAAPAFDLTFYPIEGTDYTVTDNGNGTGTLILKKELWGLLPVTLSVVPDGAQLVVTIQFNNDEELQFTCTVVSEDVYTVTISGGGSGASGAGDYTEGDIVNINAGSSSGYTFNGWTSDDVVITNASSQNASFTMPANNVTVTANWKSSVGSIGGGGGGGVVTPTVTDVEIKTAPDKVNYEEGDALDLTGLKVTLTYSNGTTKDIALADFADNKITVTPKAGDVLDADDKEIVITVNGKTAKQTITVKEDATVIPPVEEEPVLTDIDGHWAQDGIDYLVEMGAISGYPNGTFRPDTLITRAEFAKVIVDAFELTAGSDKTFTDTADHWAKDYIAIAATKEIVLGYNEDEFGPDDLITREQMAIIIVKAAGLTAVEGELNFADQAEVSSWAYDWVVSATQNKIMSGYENNTFKPLNNATRAEAATVIYNVLIDVK